MLEHKHLIIRAECLKPPKTTAFVEKWLQEIIEGIGMKVAVGPQSNPISYYCETEGNRGLTGVAILETSHCAVHVWDEQQPAIIQFDIYTCSALTPTQIIPFFTDFDVTKLEYTFIDRETRLLTLDDDVYHVV